jgi:MFS transporter, DHA1 family, multidrug resistance protein
LQGGAGGPLERTRENHYPLSVSLPRRFPPRAPTAEGIEGPGYLVDSWKRTFYAVCGAEVLAITGFNTSIPILPFYIQDLGVTDTAAVNVWVGACATAVAVSLAVFAPIWGRLADSYGKRLMLLRAMIGGAVVMALMGVVTAPWQLLVLRAFQGALTGTVAAATVLVAGISPKEHAGWSLGLLTTAVYVGGSMGPALGGVISDLLGHRVCFFVTGGLLAAAAALILRFVPRDPPSVRAEGPAWRNALPDFTPLLASRSLAALLILSGVVQVATSIVSPILPLFIQSITPSGVPVATMTGLILGLGALAGALAAAGLGRVSYRIGYQRTLNLCLLGALATTVPQAFVSTAWQLLALRVLGGAFFGGTMPAVNALIALRAERGKQGSVFGLSSSINSTGAAVGPMIGAVIATGFGYPATFYGMAAMLVLTAAGSLTLVRRQRQVAPRP